MVNMSNDGNISNKFRISHRHTLLISYVEEYRNCSRLKSRGTMDPEIRSRYMSREPLLNEKTGHKEGRRSNIAACLEKKLIKKI